MGSCGLLAFPSLPALNRNPGLAVTVTVSGTHAGLPHTAQPPPQPSPTLGGLVQHLLPLADLGLIWECGGVWAVGSPMLGLWESALVLGKGPKGGEAPLCLWVFPGLGVICSQPDGGASLSRGYSQGPKGRGSEGELQG